MLDPYSLEDGVVSLIIPLTTFSDDIPAIVELVSTDDLQKYENFDEIGVSLEHSVEEKQSLSSLESSDLQETV